MSWMDCLAKMRQADLVEVASGGWGAVRSKAGFVPDPPDTFNVG